MLLVLSMFYIDSASVLGLVAHHVLVLVVHMFWAWLCVFFGFVFYFLTIDNCFLTIVSVFLTIVAVFWDCL